MSAPGFLDDDLDDVRDSQGRRIDSSYVARAGARRSRSTRPTPAVTGSRPRSTVRNAPVWIDTAHGTQK
jgi:hypothetical protein